MCHIKESYSSCKSAFSAERSHRRGETDGDAARENQVTLT